MRVSSSQERIKYLLEYYHITAAELCRKTGLSKQAVCNYMSGRRLPRQDQIDKIARAYDVDPAWIMGYDVNMKPSPVRETEDKTYYSSSETAEAAQEIFNNDDMRVLFDAARDSRPEDLRMAADLLRRLKATNPAG